MRKSPIFSIHSSTCNCILNFGKYNSEIRIDTITGELCIDTQKWIEPCIIHNKDSVMKENKP